MNPELTPKAAREVERLYPVKWFGHPFSMGMKHPECTLQDCDTRDHWHSRESVLRKKGT